MNGNLADKKRASLVSVLLILISIAIAVVPELERNLPKNFWVAIIVIWYAYIGIFEKQHLKNGKYFIVFLLGWFVYDILLKIVGFSSAEIGNYFLKLACFDIIIKCLYIKNSFTESQKHLTIRFVQLIAIVCSVQNVILGNVIEDVHNLIYVYPENFIGMNVALTEYYNFLSFLIGITVLLLFREQKNIFKLWDVSVIVSSYYFMWNYSPRSTALSVSIVLIMMAIVSRADSLQKRKRMLIWFAIGGLASYYLLSEYIVNFLPERVALRFTAIKGSNVEAEDYLSRSRLIKLNIESFLSSPIWGIGYHLGDKLGSKVGQHSLITDFMACYGMIGIAFLYGYFRRIGYLMKSGLKNSIIGNYGRYLFIVFIVTSILSNTMFPTTMISALLLYCLI